jgi:hypothetical protein
MITSCSPTSYRRPAAWPRNIRKRQRKENKARLKASLQHLQEADLSLFSRLVECTERRCRRFVLVRSNFRCFLGFIIVWVRRAPLSLGRGSTGVNVGPPGDGHSVFPRVIGFISRPARFFGRRFVARQHHDGNLVVCSR